MRKCPIKGCSCSIADRMFVCNMHWRKFPIALKSFVSETFRRYIEEEISLSELRELTNQVLADFQGIAIEEVDSQPLAAAVTLCRHCGATLIAGHEQDPKGEAVIIGGKATYAQGRAKIYTRFTMHCCTGLILALKDTKCKPTSSTGKQN